MSGGYTGESPIIPNPSVASTELTNPMTTEGDSIVGGPSGVPARLALGTAGHVRRVNLAGTAEEFAAAESAGQPLDSDLTAIAALTTTAFGRAVLALANAGALATAAGVGTGDSPTFAGAVVSASNPYVAALNSGDGTTSYFGTYPGLFQFSFNRRPSDGVISNASRCASYVNITGESNAGYISFHTTNTPNVGPGEKFRISGSGLVEISSGGTLSIGATSAITGIRTAVATLNFASIAAGAYEDLTITVTGASAGMSVELGLPAAPDPDIVFTKWATTNTVTIRARNVGVGAVDIPSASYRATVISF